MGHHYVVLLDDDDATEVEVETKNPDPKDGRDDWYDEFIDAYKSQHASFAEQDVWPDDWWPKEARDGQS